MHVTARRTLAGRLFSRPASLLNVFHWHLTDDQGADMAGIFPDPYMHIGGDENNGVQWSHNPRIQEFMKAHNPKDKLCRI
jgi:N-acetyl-beta-hexosaminidase